MKKLATWGELFLESIRDFGISAIESLPGIIFSILILLLGWLAAKVISLVFVRILSTFRFDTLAAKINADDLIKKANIEMTPSQLVGKFIYWLLILMVITTTADALGWNAVSSEISNLMHFLPRLMVAIVFFIVGTFVATFIRDVIRGATSSIGISTGKLISNVVFYLFLIVVVLTSLKQTGIDTSIITSNLLLILGAVLAAAAISYGLASKDVLSNILASFFSRKTFGIGQTIKINGTIGTIIDMNNISVTVQDDEGNKIIIPTNQLINNQVTIYQKGNRPSAS